MDAASQPNGPVNASNGAVPEKDAVVIAKLRKLKISAHRDYPDGCGPPKKTFTQKREEEANAEAIMAMPKEEEEESKVMPKEIKAISGDEENKTTPKEEESKAMLKESQVMPKESKAIPEEEKSKAKAKEKEEKEKEKEKEEKEKEKEKEKEEKEKEKEKSKVAEKKEVEEKEEEKKKEAEKEKEKERSKVSEKKKEAEKKEKEEEEKKKEAEKEKEEEKKVEVEKGVKEKPVRSTLRDYPEDCAPPNKPDVKELKPVKSNLRDYPDGCGLSSPSSSAPLQRKIETMEIKKSFQRKKRATELELTEEMKRIAAAIDSIEEAPTEAPKNEKNEGKERRNTSPMEKKSAVLSEVAEKTPKTKKKVATKAISGGKEGSREKHKEQEEEEEESVIVPTPRMESATSSFEHVSNGAEDEREEEEAFVSAIAMLLKNDGGNVGAAASTMESPTRAFKKEAGSKQTSANKGAKVTIENAKVTKKGVTAKQATGSNKGSSSGGKGLRTPETTVGSQSKKRKIPETETKVEKLLNTPGSASAGRKRKSVASAVVTPDASSSSGQKKPRRSAGKSNKKVSSSVNTGDPRKDVVATLRLYDAARRYLLQKEELEGKQGGPKTRSDLVAGSMINASGLSANRGEKMVGPVPGIKVGDQFYYRMELSCVGMHGPIQSGIEYLTTKESEWGTPVATSVIASSGCEEQDTGDSIIYTGQGGKSGGNLKQNFDQKLERGNLGLEGSKQHKTPVRVVRGIKDVGTPTGKIYSYDGLYTVESSYLEKTKEGFEEYKFKLVRIPGQPELGSNVLKRASEYCRNPLSREDVCVQDISKGKESLAVCVVNTIDNEGGPSSFTYATQSEYPSDLEQLELIAGCECQGACAASQGCACFVKNGNEFAYLNSGTFIKDKGLIYECSSQCKCSTVCRNRVTQKGLKYHFEVFKKDGATEWGVRSWESIPAGSFICEYTGKIVHDPEMIDLLSGLPFVMNLKQVFESSPSTWGEASALFDGHSLNRTLSEPIDLMIDATKCGNFSRFINHSSSPNLLVQYLLREHEDQRFPRVMLFAMDNIPPMTELTLDYGLGNE